MDVSDEVLGFSARVRPMYRAAYRAAHAICGNSIRAELAVDRALADAFSLCGDAPGAKNALREAVVSQALALAEDEAAADYPPDVSVFSPLVGTEPTAFQTYVAAESETLRRALLLRAGCNLSISQIARLLDAAPAQLKRDFARLADHFSEKNAFWDEAKSAAKADLSRPGIDTPDPDLALRRLTAQLTSESVRPHRLRTLVRALISLVGLLILAAILWLAAVLAQ